MPAGLTACERYPCHLFSTEPFRPNGLIRDRNTRSFRGMVSAIAPNPTKLSPLTGLGESVAHPVL